MSGVQLYLQRLPFGDIVVRMQELLIFCEHLRDILKHVSSSLPTLVNKNPHSKAHPVVILLQEISTHNLVSCEEILTGNRGDQLRAAGVKTPHLG